MDGFGDNFDPSNSNLEEDPAADFIAREQHQLEGLDVDINTASDGVVNGDLQVNGGDTFDYQFNNAGFPSNFLSKDDLFPEDSIPEVEVPLCIPGEEDPALNILDEKGGEESLLPEAEVEPPAFNNSAFETMTMSDVDASDKKEDFSTERRLSPAPSPVPVRVEPEKIRIWREEQAARLEIKDEAEKEAMEELRQRAHKELEEWYQQHEEQLTKTRQANRSAEKDLIADTGKIIPGTEWERIAKLCDFNPKTAKSSRDISRMRSIILQLKQNPPLKA